MSLSSVRQTVFRCPELHLRVTHTHSVGISCRAHPGMTVHFHCASMSNCSDTVGSADPYECPYCTKYNRTTRKVLLRLYVVTIGCKHLYALQLVQRASMLGANYMDYLLLLPHCDSITRALHVRIRRSLHPLVALRSKRRVFADHRPRACHSYR